MPSLPFVEFIEEERTEGKEEKYGQSNKLTYFQ